MSELLHERADMTARASQYGCTSGQIGILHERAYMGIESRAIMDRVSKIFVAIFNNTFNKRNYTLLRFQRLFPHASYL